MRDAVALLSRREDIDFEFEGEMSPDVALDPDARLLYPFSAVKRAGECADHAGDPLGVDFHEAAGELGRRERLSARFCAAWITACRLRR